MMIGNASGFWGDHLHAARSLVEEYPDLEYLTFDFLSELSLSIMASSFEKGGVGYAKDMLEIVRSLLSFWERGGKTKLITNGGGLDPQGLAKEIDTLLKAHKIPLKVAYVLGDDVKNFFPEKNTANAYLGIDGIVEALKKGADIVVTGRVADPSLTLAPLKHAFQWDSLDLLAQGAIAGHLIECGPQVTGGISGQYLEGEPPYRFPVLKVFSDGTLLVKKGKNRLVNCVTVREQLLYEIHDPFKTITPDVVFSYSDLILEETPEGVLIKNGRGFPAPLNYKINTTKKIGFKAESTLLLTGDHLEEKAKRVFGTLQERVSPQKMVYELFGSSFEALFRVAAFDPEESVIKHFTQEIAPFVTGGPSGTSGYAQGRAPVRTVYEYQAAFLPKDKITLEVTLL